MPLIAKSGIPSLSTPNPSSQALRTGKRAGEAIAAGDALYSHTDGRLYRATGAAANAAAVVVGFAAVDAAVGDAVTALAAGVMMHYGAGLTPGTPYYLSGTTAGGIDTAASTGGTAPIAYAWDATQIILKPNV